jgi:hypothetical protein
MDKNILDMQKYASNDEDAYLMNYMLNGIEDAIQTLNSEYLFDLFSAVKMHKDINRLNLFKFEALHIMKEVYLALCFFKNDEVIEMFKQ